MTYSDMIDLANAARPTDDDDWGSERQIAAQNAFFIAVENEVSEADFSSLEDYCMKATVDEMVDEALRILIDGEYIIDPAKCRHRDSGRGVCVDCGEFLC